LGSGARFAARVMPNPRHFSWKESSMAHQQYASCIEACNQCAVACEHCATACLKEPDPKAMARCIELDMDCAAICRLAAAAMARGSENARAICALCGDICEMCGDECAKHQMDHCQECAQMCRRCADECRRMSQQRGAQPSSGVRASSAH
jgi:hypothetical protein